MGLLHGQKTGMLPLAGFTLIEASDVPHHPRHGLSLSGLLGFA